jgi:hypothetical protein
MQVFGISKAFDCLNLVSICLDSKHQTGADGLPVEQDCTGTADTMFTSDVSAGQAEVIRSAGCAALLCAGMGHH